ncbi:MAG: diacylglycerol kinase, partial [Chitinophagaceae bacterium]
AKDGNYSSFHEIIKREKITDVLICGGDGTVNQVVSGLRDLNLNFGIIPMGSGNGLAYAAGIPYSTKKALQIALNAQPVWTDAFTVNGKFSCMLSGVGIDAKIAHDFATVKKRGLTTYLKKSLRHYFLSKPFPFSVDTGTFKFSTDAYFISIANSNQFGNYVTIAPMASLNDGLLDVVVVNRMNKIALLYQIARQIRSGKVMQPADLKKPSGISYFQCKKLTLHNPGLAPLHLDGEPIETSEWIEIQVIEHAFRLIKP